MTTNETAAASSLEMDIRPANDELLKETGEVHQKLLSENADEPTKDEETKEPIDRFYIVYFIFVIHGIGVLMPWNMFITANDYFVNYKLAPNTNVTGTEVEKTVYQNYFLGLLGFVAQIPTVIINGVNTFSHVKGGNISTRIVWSIIIVCVMFVATIVLAMVDSSEWPAAFFWLTMVSVVIINMANGIYQNSIFGTAACLPMKYPNAVIVGSNISGTLTSVIMLLSIAGSPNPRTSAIYYFLTAIFILLLAFNTFYILDFLPFYRYHSNKGKKPKASKEDDNTRPPYWEIFKQCWLHDLSVFLVFFVTLSVFPAVQANIRASDPNFFISEKYYSPVTCFLLFNLFAVVGNVISAFVQKPGPRWAWIPITLRLLFIPFFMFCNFNPTTRNLPVLISNDYVYIVGAIALAVTSGYFSSLAMMYAPNSVRNPEHKGVAGMMGAFFLVLGIFIGVTFSIPVTMFITNVGNAGGSADNGLSTVATFTNSSSLL